MAANRNSQTARDAANNRSFADIFHNQYTAWVILGISLLITAFAWYVSSKYVERRAQERFAFAVEDARQRIVNRMEHYQQVLRSGVSLFATLNGGPSRQQWRTYVSNLAIQKLYPGIQGIGYAVMLDPAEVASHIASVRNDGFADYDVKPPGRRDIYSANVYLEPFDWRNQRAFGYDMFSNPMRRTAMEHARDSGTAAVSGRVTLVQETQQDVQAGFLMYLPVYAQGTELTNTEQRRRALTGFVYSPFRISDLMRGILGTDLPNVQFQLFDGAEEQSVDTLLYQSARDAVWANPYLQQEVPIDLPGRRWVGRFQPTVAFVQSANSQEPALILAGGIILDVLLFLVIWSLARQRQRVERRVTNMTHDLRKSVERLRLAQSTAGFSLWELELPSEKLRIDDAQCGTLCLPKEQMPDDLASWLELVDPDSRKKFRDQLAAVIKGKSTLSVRFRLPAEAGAYRYLELLGGLSPVRERGQRSFVGTLIDVTDRHRAEDQLRLAASVFEQAHEGIIVTDTSQRIVDVNQAFTLLTGYSRDEAIGQTPAMLKSEKHDADFYKDMWGAIQTQGYWRGQIWNRRKSGEIFAQMETISAIRDEEGNVTRYVAVFSDITRLLEQQKKLEHMAHYDALTGLPNRVLLADRLQQAMASAKRAGDFLAVCYVDLDGFKPVNDKYGHPAGDELLVEVARRLQDVARESDSVARIGGDEFVILLTGLPDPSGCETAIQRMLAAISGEYAVQDGKAANITASAGAALFPLDDSDADTLLRHADQAMYSVKQNGRGHFRFFDAKQNREFVAHQRTREEIGIAIRSGQFELHYQPKVNMRTGVVVGAEALIRWNHPERGLIPPIEFLPVLEHDDLAVDLDLWVLRDVLRQQAEWQAAGIHLKVGVNIIPYHIQKPGFVDRLQRVRDEFPDVAVSSIDIELLETTALRNLDAVAEIIDECKALGVSVSLDDFGTGYASLQYLRRLPFDTLKIDRSFVRDMLDDEEDRAIVEGIIGLSKAFHRQVIAEGVESEAHGNMLMRMGCDLAQGYGIAKPMQADAFAEWLKTYRPPRSWQSSASGHWSRDDAPLFSAAYQHYAWLDRFTSDVRSEWVASSPSADIAPDAQFEHWIETVGAERYGLLAEFEHTRESYGNVRKTARAMVQFLLARNRERVAQCYDVLTLQSREFLTHVASLQEELDNRARGSNVYRLRRKAG